jgi:RNA polymerase sigma factor (TIGR02999 family)
MGESLSPPLTQLLNALSDGDASAHEKLWSLIYAELHDLAVRQMADEATGRTLQPTALVHEAYLRLLGMETTVDWANRRQFFKAAAEVMRHIRIDYARKRRSLKRGGDRERVPLEAAPITFDEDPAQVLAVDEALRRLEAVDPRKAQLVNLRYFAGLTIEETAEMMGLAPRTVSKEWRFARAWLHCALGDGDAPSGDNPKDGR